MYNSIIKECGIVSFPEFLGERVYMLPFKKKDGLPNNLKHWQPTMSAMLEKIDTHETLYLIIDQKQVKADSFHRRRGLHIDGYWVPDLQCHDVPGHRVMVSQKDEAIMLASNVQACRAFAGPWRGEIGEGGACSNIDVSNAREVIFKPNVAYLGNVCMLHESLPVPFDCERTVVRLNIPNYRIIH